MKISLNRTSNHVRIVKSRMQIGRMAISHKKILKIRLVSLTSIPFFINFTRVSLFRPENQNKLHLKNFRLVRQSKCEGKKY